MKSVYWRPKKITGTTTFLVGLAAAMALAAVELAPRFAQPPYADEQQQANELAQQCRNQISQARRSRELRVNRMFDPTRSGILGRAMTPITSKPADLEAKQLSIHPQFPGVIVQMLHDAGVQKGDTVAICWTGSFPGLNVALAAAVESLELQPIAITSILASQYGANEPELTWLDMEASLQQANLTSFHSQLATTGGPADSGAGMDRNVIQLAGDAAERNQIRFLRAKRLRGSIKQRMKVFDQAEAEGHAIKAYINVGGGVASCGGTDCIFASGVHHSKPQVDDGPDCMMQRFSERGVPVIHLAQTKRLARRYRLSADPTMWNTVQAGMGRPAPNRLGACLAFLLVCGILRAFILEDTGNRLVHALVSRLRGRTVLRAVGQREGPQLMA